MFVGDRVKVDKQIYSTKNEILEAYYIDRLNEYLKHGEVTK